MILLILLLTLLVPPALIAQEEWDDIPAVDSIERRQDSVLTDAYFALSQDSTLVLEYEKIAGIYKARKRFIEELKITSRIISINPYSPIANFIHADALLDNGQIDSALPHLYRTLAMEPSYVRARTTIAEAFTIRKAYDTALWHLDTAILQNPRYAQAHVQRAAILTTLGRDTEAIANYRQAAELLANSPASWMRLAQGLLRVGALEEAVGALEYITRIETTSSDAYYILAETQERLGRNDDALVSYRNFIERFPFDDRRIDAERAISWLRSERP